MGCNYYYQPGLKNKLDVTGGVFASLPPSDGDKVIILTAGLCNGSTADSDSACLGSNPSPATNIPFFDDVTSRRSLLSRPYEFFEDGVQCYEGGIVSSYYDEILNGMLVPVL